MLEDLRFSYLQFNLCKRETVFGKTDNYTPCCIYSKVRKGTSSNQTLETQMKEVLKSQVCARFCMCPYSIYTCTNRSVVSDNQYTSVINFNFLMPLNVQLKFTTSEIIERPYITFM